MQINVLFFCLFVLFCFVFWKSDLYGLFVCFLINYSVLASTPESDEAGGVAVPLQRLALLSPGSFPDPNALCAFGFLTMLASAGFSLGSPVFQLHLKLFFL